MNSPIKHRQGMGMSKKIQLSVSMLALAVGACLALTGCDRGGSSSAASGGNAPRRNTSGGNSSTACAAFTTIYEKFLAGYTPPESQTGTAESPLMALSHAVADITAAGQTEQDLSNLGIDAGLIASGSTEGGQTTPPSAFSSDLQAVGKDCGTTFTQPPASLVSQK